MGEKRLVTIAGKTLSLTQWAESLGLSRQRIYRLYTEGKLEDRVKGVKLKAGRPSMDAAIRQALRIPRTQREVCEIVGCSRQTFYRYAKNNNVIKEEGKYVEFD